VKCELLMLQLHPRNLHFRVLTIHHLRPLHASAAGPATRIILDHKYISIAHVSQPLSVQLNTVSGASISGESTTHHEVMSLRFPQCMQK